MTAMALLAAWALLWPYYNAIQGVRDTIEAKEIELDQKKKFIQKVTDLSKQIEARQEDLIKVESFLSSGKHTAEVVVNLEAIFRESGVAVSEFKVGMNKEKSGENFEILQVEFTASGPYVALFNMIKLIERNLRLFDIQEINMVKKEEAIVSSPLIATIKLNTYFIR